jgi:threonine dehydratase
VDLSLERIEASLEEIDPVFLDTPQFVSDRLSNVLGREVLVKVETLNPIGSFKGRGYLRAGAEVGSQAHLGVRHRGQLRAGTRLCGSPTGSDDAHLRRP